ncbi:hypothetical protein CCMSSC00406_0009460 [Pleurotus cornucopiae]|uniref:Uncharacterized protein n=1 Tax=Pleurotus cornucopiae TaxID=5321 RepID=A0ACB7J3K6_PLECO|nr:hypothetical protein CCMSSC00406_0009460 [Pleurotus cornucopiae]
MDGPVSPNSSSKVGQSGMTEVASSNKGSGGGTTAKPTADKPVAPFESTNKESGSSCAPVRVAANDKPSAGVNKGMSSKPSTKLGQDSKKTKIETPYRAVEHATERQRALPIRPIVRTYLERSRDTSYIVQPRPIRLRTTNAIDHE